MPNHAAAVQKWQDKQREAGRCIICGNKAKGVRCPKHLLADKLRKREARRKLTA